MRHGIQDDRDMQALSARAEAVAFEAGVYRQSVCGLCAGSGIPVKRRPDSPQDLDQCGNCLGVGLVWRTTEGQTDHILNAREVLLRAGRGG